MKSKTKKRVLVIVAHPDDETIWMGGTLLIHRKDWQTTIVSLCREDDKDRAPRFQKACKLYKAKCFMSDLEDEDLENEKVDDAVERIEQFVDDKFDFIFTHGKNGEYGHKRHKDVHKAVTKMLKEKKFNAKKVFFFSYAQKAGACAPDKNADKFINLDKLIFERKKYLVKDIYNFKEESFEFKSSRNIESFKVKKII
jgi:LmbE family N-acetylglucosaminyl deacetylase